MTGAERPGDERPGDDWRARLPLDARGRYPGGGRPAGPPPALVRAVDRALDALDALASRVERALSR